MCKTHSVQAPHRATQNERTLHTCPRNRLLQEVWSHEGNREKHGVTSQRNDVHRLQLEQTGKSQNVGAWAYLEQDSPSPLLLGRSCNELGYSLCARPTRGTHRLSIGNKVIDCGIENFVSVEVPDKKWNHPKKSRQPWVTESWREMCTTP